MVHNCAWFEGAVQALGQGLGIDSGDLDRMLRHSSALRGRVIGLLRQLRSEEQPHPGWISFSIDGRYAYPDGGAVIDAKTKQIAARVPTSEKLLEVDFRDGKPAQAGHR